MIKTPIRKEMKIGQWPIIDAHGVTRLLAYTEDDADQIVSALNAQKPVCETCGGSGKKEVKPKPTIEQLEKFQSGGIKFEIMPDGRTLITCPDCPPATQTGELVGHLRNAAGVLDIMYPITAKVRQNIIETCQQAAARIEELEKALEKHKHTDECLRYAAKTSKASGVYHCIAKCADSLKATLGEETK